MGKKLDLSPIKDFFFEKGEKLAAIVCGAVAVLLIGMGVMSGLSAQTAPGTNQSFDKALQAQAKRIGDMNTNGTDVKPLPETKYTPDWRTFDPTFAQLPLFYTIDNFTNKRHNPTALAAQVNPELKQVQMDYIRGPIEVYEKNDEKQWATTVKAANAGVVGDPRQKQPKNNQFSATALEPITTVDPKRMIVVHATFPLEQQVQEFARALKMMHISELWTGQKDTKDPNKVMGSDLPKFLGVNIMKCEVTAGQPEWKPLVSYDWKKDSLDVDAALWSTLKSMVFDDMTIGVDGGLPPAAVFQGLAMPLPKLGGGMLYPKVDLPGVEPAWDAMNAVGPMGGGRPMFNQNPRPNPGVNPGMGAPGGKIEDLDTRTHWGLLAPQFKDRFFGKFYALDPEGKNFDVEDPNQKGPGYVPPRGFPGTGNQPTASPYAGGSQYAAGQKWASYPYPPPPPMPAVGPNGQPAPQQFPMNQPMNMGKPYDAVIRFFDVDVVPGKTYKYSIQVRIANPNYGKKGDVAQAAFADVKELAPAPPVETPEITIPEEYFVYATDQKPMNPKVPDGSDTESARPDQVAVQIHRWVAKTTDIATGLTHNIGDWAIAERLLVRRGDPIGRTIHVEVPVWNAKLGAFSLVAALGSGEPNDPFGMKGKQPNNIVLPPIGLGKNPGKKPAMGEKGSMGIPVDFTEGVPPAVLADFDGGKQAWSPRTSSTTYKDESASNLLILRPDGRLIVRNTRIDSDENTPEYRERADRVAAWEKKTAPLRAVGAGEAAPEMKGPNPFFKKN